MALRAPIAGSIFGMATGAIGNSNGRKIRNKFAWIKPSKQVRIDLLAIELMTMATVAKPWLNHVGSMGKLRKAVARGITIDRLPVDF